VIEFSRKVAIISGAGSGIGAGLADALAAANAKVAVADINLPSAQSVADGINARGGGAMALQLDVTSPSDWASGVAKVERELGQIDILCSNAGVVGSMKPLTELPADYMRWVLDVNVMGVLHAAQAVIPRMKARGSGHVLITASMAGLSALQLMSDYCASKHALIAIADCLRQELSGTGVGVSVLCPSAVATGLSQTTQRELRPELAAGIELDGPLAAKIKGDATKTMGGAISAAEAARIALDGVRREQFYIFTHAGSDTRAQACFGELKVAMKALETMGATIA